MDGIAQVDGPVRQNTQEFSCWFGYIRPGSNDEIAQPTHIAGQFMGIDKDIVEWIRRVHAIQYLPTVNELSSMSSEVVVVEKLEALS